MPRPPDMPKDIDTGGIGRRVRWWRVYRKRSRKWLANKCGMAIGTLSDLEIGRTDKGGYLHSIATHLKLNPNYLETGKGEPEESVPAEPPEAGEQWPLAPELLSKITRLNVVERTFMESAMLRAFDVIEAERKKAQKG